MRNAAHFRIHRYPGRLQAIPITVLGWFIFTAYLIVTMSILTGLTVTIFPVMQRPILFFLFMTIGALALIGGLVWIIFRMGEVIDHR